MALETVCYMQKLLCSLRLPDTADEKKNKNKNKKRKANLKRILSSALSYVESQTLLPYLCSE